MPLNQSTPSGRATLKNPPFCIMSIRTYFENIATAIKEKNPDVVTVTPSEMPDAILNIPAGGGGVLEPIVYDSQRGYVNSASDQWYYSPQAALYFDAYKVEIGKTYAVFIGPNYGNRFRTLVGPQNPATYNGTIDGYFHNVYDGYGNGKILWLTVTNKYEENYLIISKSNNGQSGIKSNVVLMD